MKVQILILAVCAFALACSTTSDLPPTPPAPSASFQPSIGGRLLQRRQRHEPNRPKPSDMRTPAQLAEAACRSPDGAWRCLTKPSLRSNASQQSIFPVSWTVPAWFVDPSNASGTASDSNDCTTAATPCRTYQEINVHRWGCLGSPTACPRLRQDTTITWLSSATDDSDPAYILPAMENGAQIVITSQLPTAAASVCGAGATLANVTTLVRGTNLTRAQVNLSGGGACTITAGDLIVNATHSSRAWAYTISSGSIWNWSQPMLPENITNVTSPPTEVTNWTNGDAVTVYSLPVANIAVFNPTFDEWNGSFSNYPALYQIGVFDPQFLGADPITLGSRLTIVESFSQRIAVVKNVVDFATFYNNDDFIGGWVVSAPVLDGFTGIYGGIAAGSGFNFNNFTGLVNIDGDIILADNTSFGGAGTASDFSTPLIGTAYIETGKSIEPSGIGIFGSVFNANQAVVYGGGGLSFRGNARWLYRAGAGEAAGTFKQTGGFTLSGQTTACLIIPSNASAYGTCNLTFSPAVLDANLGAAIGCFAGTGDFLCTSNSAFP